MSLPPAGWHPDPSAPGQLRWWDGQTWTDHRAPLPAQVVVRPTSPKALVALVLGILSVVACTFLTGIPAVLLGWMARREIARSDGRLDGSPAATVGMVLGLVGTVLGVVLLAVWLWLGMALAGP